MGGMRYRIIGTMPEGEEWAFTPGEEVECDTTEVKKGKKVLTAKHLAPVPL